MARLILFTDGAARGNPGPAAMGVVLTDAKGKVIEEHGRVLGEMTNNEAEYRALLWGVERAQANLANEIEVRSDSELLVRQLKGIYRVRAANLKPLFEQARSALARFERVSIHHIPREQNRRADALANAALDKA
ncbi:MAG TPA: ribonuclease HI family protein [Anaerolineae bacterium]